MSKTGYQLIFEVEGFHPLHLDAQKAVIGEHTEILAELTPLN